MAIQKGEKMVLEKLENFTNKDIIKEEAEILTNLIRWYYEKFGSSGNLW